jgi:hypothetical protein
MVVPSISNWNTSKAMSSMFYAPAFNQKYWNKVWYGTYTAWDTLNVTDMNAMFGKHSI